MGYQDDSYEDYGQYGEDTAYEEGGMAQGNGNGNSKGKIWPFLYCKGWVVGALNYLSMW